MTTLQKIKNKIKLVNTKKNNLLYWIAVAILVAIGLFILITMIIQTNWVGIQELTTPILVWIISQPLVGVFFLPFLFLLSYMCWFIVSVGKPVSIKNVMSDTRTLYENNDINENEYQTIFEKLTDAQNRNEENKKEKLDKYKDIV